ncbi:hypothetical protein KBX37_33530, partial [Micromonospora sp. U56]|uniref:hypothetical protein n=1 Tax=Micromonospora sp. U56 TaxID=2824900 RepID=UPI001B37D482
PPPARRPRPAGRRAARRPLPAARRPLPAARCPPVARRRHDGRQGAEVGARRWGRDPGAGAGRLP